ncbi:MAG: glucosaminidase domain-containing protein [Bacteroidales bacterium]|nr:glucosaminidase domain-containing protein [Bacteroidales bacterium]
MPFLARKLILLTTLLVLSGTLLAQRITREEYIKTYKDLAIRQMKSHGIPASIILAQACLESGDGNSRLAREANNHFGIKCHNWTGETILHDDDEKNECFRKYSHPEGSFTDHSEFLRYRERYKILFDLDPLDYKAWAHGLKSAGYATNPDYARLLIKIIEDYRLYLFDSSSSELPPSPSQVENEYEIDMRVASDVYQFSLARKLLNRNGITFIIAGERDSYSSLAKEYNLFTRELLRFNDLNSEVPISEGTIVYLERKRERGDKDLSKHIAESGETMYYISQKYAIRLSTLYKINNMKKGDEPFAGYEIKLR